MSQSKVFDGVFWASIQRFGTLGISFVSNMVMARLLTPGDFGTIGMLMFFLAITQTFIDSGFGAALIQKKYITEADTSTVFYVNLVLSFVFYAILFCFAPLISSFYNVTALTLLLRVMGLTIIITGLTLIQSTRLQKEMNFKILSLCNLIGAIVMAIVGVVTALCGFGVWSLVFRSLAGTAITSILLWRFSKWRPTACFSLESFRSLFGFGSFMLLSSLIMNLSNNIQTLMIGKMSSTSTLGNFTQANNLRNLSCDGIQSVIAQVLFPEFSKFQDNDIELKRKVDLGIYVTAIFTVPLMIWMCAFAKPIVFIIYGNQWGDVVPLLQILCIGGVFYSIQDVNINLIKAKGKSNILFYFNFLKLLISIAVIYIGGYFFGIIGIVSALALNSLLGYIVYSSLSAYFTKSNNLMQYFSIIKCTILSVIPYLVVSFNNIFNNLVWDFILNSIIFWLLYFLIVKLTKVMPYQYILKQVNKHG